MSALKPSGGVPEPGDLVQRLMGSGSSSPTRVSEGAVQVVVEGSLAARVRYLVRQLFLPRAGMAMVYRIPINSPQIWLAYLWRPIDLLGRYGRTAWRVLRGDHRVLAAWQREVWLERWLRGEARE